MKKNLKKIITYNPFSFLMIPALIFLIYSKIFQTYFQQDEWYGFGQAIYAKQFGISHLLGVLGGYHLTPFSNLLFSTAFSFFGLSAIGYAWSSILLHCISSLLVFFLTLRITNNKNTSLFAAFIFAASNTHQQAITYFGTTLGVIPAVIFGIISLYFFLLSQQRKKAKVIGFLLLSLISLFVGLGFKEDIFGLFIFYCFFLFIKKTKKEIILVAFFGVLYGVLRLLFQVFSTQGKTAGMSIVGYIQNISLHIMQFYPKGFGQIILTQTGILQVSKWMTTTVFDMFQFSVNPEVFAETITAPLVAYILFFFLISVILWLFINKRLKRKEKEIIIFLLSLIVASIFPFVFLPSYAVMESRHFYFPMVGGSMLIAYLASLFPRLYKNIYSIIVVISFATLYLFWNVTLTEKHLVFLQQIAMPRVSLVKQVQNTYSNLPKKAIVYATGDLLPLQSSPGELFIVVLNNKQIYWAFFKENFFWDHVNGYQEKNGVGFGFFYDKQMFSDTYMKNHLRPENVFSFTWDAKTLKLIDTTKQTRETFQ